MSAGIEGASASGLLSRALGRAGALPDGDFRVIAAGKAATSMASTLDRICGSRIRAGLVIGAPPQGASAPFESILGSHPVPGPESERAGRRAIELARTLDVNETLLVLLSGGASAMMAVPADGLTLEDKQRTTERLLKSGADIFALNTVRKHISSIKGGGLAASAAGPSRTFAISDVVGDDLSVIASGPTVADSSTYDDAFEVLRRFGGVDAFPSAVVARIRAGQRGEVSETPKAADGRLARASSSVVGGRRDAMAGAATEAEARGYHVVRIEEPVVGDARTISISHMRALLERAADRARPLCFVSSGETTVHVTGHGKGGRNQEFALAAADFLATLPFPVVVASAGTDGIDGPTDAAGALTDSTTLERARAAGVGAPDRFLADNNAYAFFDAIGDLIKTGPTDTNVGDLQVVLLG